MFIINIPLHQRVKCLLNSKKSRQRRIYFPQMIIRNFWVIILIIFAQHLIGCNQIDDENSIINESNNELVDVDQNEIEDLGFSTSNQEDSSISMLPDILLAGIKIIDKGQETETHEVWLIDAKNNQENLVFTTSPGRQISTLFWGGSSSKNLFVLEVKDSGNGYNIWQINKLNYEEKSNEQIFDNHEPGFPRFLDISAGGRWLRILVTDLTSPDIGKIWFLNTEDNTVIRTEDFFYGFAWSSSDPDKFAYLQELSNSDDVQLTEKIIIKRLPDLEIDNNLNVDSINLGVDTVSVWNLEDKDQIYVFGTQAAYLADLQKGTLSLKTSNYIFLPDNSVSQNVNLSPSGKWLLLEYSGLIEVANLETMNPNTIRIENDENQRKIFLSWYKNLDMAILISENREILIFDLNNSMFIENNIALDDLNINFSEWHSVIAKSSK